MEEEDEVSVSNVTSSVWQVFWLKNGVRINVQTEINYIISSEGNLIINQARLSDMGNYTCGAQNVASKKSSEPATLTVYGMYILF